MSFRAQLAAGEAKNASMLCVGLDPEPAKFPLQWRDDPRRIFDFCSAIVSATKDLVIAFKPQIAYSVPKSSSSGSSITFTRSHPECP